MRDRWAMGSREELWHTHAAGPAACSSALQLELGRARHGRVCAAPGTDWLPVRGSHMALFGAKCPSDLTTTLAATGRRDRQAGGTPQTPKMLRRDSDTDHAVRTADTASLPAARRSFGAEGMPEGMIGAGGYAVAIGTAAMKDPSLCSRTQLRELRQGGVSTPPGSW
jgi:hypothetical protein